MIIGRPTSMQCSAELSHSEPSILIFKLILPCFGIPILYLDNFNAAGLKIFAYE